VNRKDRELIVKLMEVVQSPPRPRIGADAAAAYVAELEAIVGRMYTLLMHLSNASVDEEALEEFHHYLDELKEERAAFATNY